MTEQERERRLTELERWLTEICEELRDEALRLASEAKQVRGEDKVWRNLSSNLDVAAKVFASLRKHTDDFLTTKLQSKQDVSRYFKGAIFRETTLRPRQERGRAQAREKKLEQDRGEFKRESEDVQRERLRSAHEIRVQHAEPCLQQLSERDRRMLLAIDQDGDSIKQIAEREGITEDAAKAAISRARRRVRKCMIDRGVKFGDLS